MPATCPRGEAGDEGGLSCHYWHTVGSLGFSGRLGRTMLLQCGTVTSIRDLSRIELTWTEQLLVRHCCALLKSLRAARAT